MTNVEHDIQRLMLERLGIEWVPGEPFYSLIEAEIVRLRTDLADAIAAMESCGEHTLVLTTLVRPKGP